MMDDIWHNKSYNLTPCYHFNLLTVHTGFVGHFCSSKDFVVTHSIMQRVTNNGSFYIRLRDFETFCEAISQWPSRSFISHFCQHILTKSYVFKHWAIDWNDIGAHRRIVTRDLLPINLLILKFSSLQVTAKRKSYLHYESYYIPRAIYIYQDNNFVFVQVYFELFL